MSKKLTSLLISVVLLSLLPQVARARISIPERCNHVGKIYLSKVGTFRCTNINNKLAWKQISKKDLSPDSNGDIVSSETIQGKVLAGYQGWFACNTDDTGPTWVHWFNYDKEPTINNLYVDLWPEISEYSKYSLCPTKMKTLDGQVINAYSGYNPLVINQHFAWMQQYNIDGAAFQRFVERMEIPNIYAHDLTILKNVKRAAEKYGRTFYFAYDLGDAKPKTIIDRVKKDWMARVDEGTTTSTAYIHENGLPVVGLWGVGFPKMGQLQPKDIRELIKFFHNPPKTKYKATVMGGVGSYWRTGTGDGSPGEEWAATYRSFDIINPWAVGRFISANPESAQQYLRDVVIEDIEETSKLGILYLPVIWPGFSWKNLQKINGVTANSNEIPRFCGSFYWQQVANVINAGAKQIFIAMFDEVDEGTAMYKMVTTSQALPKNSNLLPLNIDGCTIESDFYLRLAGATTDALRYEEKVSRRLPFDLRPGENLDAIDFTRGITDGLPATSS